MAADPTPNERGSRERLAASNGDGVLFSLQALAGFTMGGLLAIVATLAAGLYAEGWGTHAGRIAGFTVGGALGGAALGVGLRPGAWKSGALGFALGFVIPAVVAGPVLSDLFALRAGLEDPTAFVWTGLAFAGGYGAAGALGASFLGSGFAVAAGARFGAAAGVGGLLAGSAPLLAGDPSGYSPGSVITALIAIVGGHITAWSLGGWLAGVGVENELKARVKPPARRVQKQFQSGVAGD